MIRRSITPVDFCIFLKINSGMSLEAVSTPQISFEGKAPADEKAQHTRKYVSILRRPATLPSELRWVLKGLPKGNPVQIGDGPAAVSEDERRHMPLAHIEL